MTAVLTVEDDQRIGAAVCSALRGEGFEVIWARSGRDALRELAAGCVDLVLLDLGLPDLDGIEVCRAARELCPSSVIVIMTARGDEMDVVVGLESGADDYVTKPFGLAELCARVRAHLRRASAGAGEGPGQVLLGDLVLDVRARVCRVGADWDLGLRAKEFDLLERLARDVGAAVSRERLMADVWDEHWYGSTKTLDVHVAALRRRLAEAETSASGRPRLPSIVTLRGFGYRLEVPAGVPETLEVPKPAQGT